MGESGARTHEKVLRTLAARLKQKGYRDIHANLKGLPTPNRITGGPFGEHVPDATGHGREFSVFEVATRENLRDPQVLEEWTSLAAHAKRRKGSFFIVVPKGVGDEARRTVSNLRLDAGVWEV